MRISKSLKTTFWVLAIGLLVFVARSERRSWDGDWAWIDAASYARGSARIYETRRIFDLPDLYHSPGFQIYVGSIRILTGNSPIGFTIVKFLNALAVIGTCLLITLMFRQLFSTSLFHWLPATMILLTPDIWKYCLWLQYEMIAMFLVTMVASLLFSNLRGRFVFAGLTVGFLCLIHARFLAFAALPFFFRPARFKSVGAFLLPILTITTLWSGYQSQRTGRFILISNNWAWNFSRNNFVSANQKELQSPNLKKVNTGLSFLAENPIQFARLCAERLGITMGILKGNWHFKHPILVDEVVFVLQGLLWGLFFYTLVRASNLTVAMIFLVLLPPMLTLGSYRFLVPALGIFYLNCSIAISLLTLQLRMRKFPAVETEARRPQIDIP